MELEERVKSAHMLYKGKIVEDPDKITFAKLFVKNNALIVLKCPEVKLKEPMKWCRFSRYVYNDYYPMSCHYWEGIVFIPKRDVWFYGWGLFADYHKKDEPLDVTWYIGEDKADQYHFTLMDDE